VRDKPGSARNLATAFDPTTRNAPSRSSGAEQRQPPSPYDRVLLPAASNWLLGLPAAVSPRETAQSYPRIVNRLARYWDSPPMIESIFDDLLVDRRHGRRGFPARIQAELRVLYAHYRSRGAARDSAAAANRKPPSLYDRSLNAAAVKWMRELPFAVRPREASMRFPRIVNRLARFWESPATIQEIFDDLLVDRRPGRKGFPPEVRAEFEALRDFSRTGRDPGSDDIWSFEPDRGRRARS
jgi:hypothetical protein